ncbi:MAG: TylF/MycF/NovP-related O-methyltransferase, partial [Pseudomonadota bacterium]|nr:TylF/MycF/NovP-related O-methyltransferase [Pseudomonadota bacterium]
SVLRLDGDWYESTISILENLYDKVATNGLILIDDYYSWDGCSRAVHDFLSDQKLPERIRQSRYGGVAYIVKENLET